MTFGLVSLVVLALFVGVLGSRSCSSELSHFAWNLGSLDQMYESCNMIGGGSPYLGMDQAQPLPRTCVRLVMQ